MCNSTNDGKVVDSSVALIFQIFMCHSTMEFRDESLNGGRSFFHPLY